MNENLAWWNERAALHGQDAVYDTRGFLAGRVTLLDIERQTVGAVAGRSLIHLQCHLGFDTLSWLRVGATSVVGVDFSPVAVERARALATQVGLGNRASFVEADVLALPDDLDGRFDVCFASFGVLSWIEDVGGWMRSAAAVLRPGGRLALVDMHPLFAMTDSVDPLRLDFPYVNDGPRRFEESGSYADPGAPTAHNATVEFGHSLGEIVTSAVQAGLVIERLGEHVEVESDVGRGLLPRDADGLIRWRHGGELLPVLYSLAARRLQLGP